MKKAKSNAPNFKISYIRIMLDTNVTDKPEVFTYSMLATPELPKNSSYKYPYFTNSLKYNDGLLSSLDKENLMKFFFNKIEFTRVVSIMSGMSDNNHVDYEKNLEILNEEKKKGATGSSFDAIFSQQAAQENENEEYNIMLLLKYMFPIHPNFNNYLKRTDDEMFGRLQGNIFRFNRHDVISSVNYFGWMNKVGAIKNEDGASYLNINKTPMIVKSVVWENDVINHPVYRDFLETYNRKMIEIRNSYFEIVKKREESENAFVEKIEKYMKKELNVDYQPAKKYNFKNITTNNTYLLEFYFNEDGTFGKINPQSPGADTNTNGYESGYNPIYNKIHSKWMDNINAVSQSSSKTSEIKSTSQIIMTELSTILRHVLEYKIAKNQKKNPQNNPNTITFIDRKGVISCYNNLIKILDENYALKSKIGSLLDFGEGENAMNDLFTAAVDLKTIDKIEAFVERNELINMDSTTENDIIKLESDTRVIKRLKNSYPQFAELSRVLVNTLKSVLPPDRKTSNMNLYELLLKTKTGSVTSENEKKVIEEAYNRYIRKADIDYKVQLEPYLYTGVDTIIGKRDNTEGDTKEQANEIYVKIDVINKSDYEKNPNCLVKDNDLKNHYIYLSETNYPYYGQMRREYIMNDPNEDKKSVDNAKSNTNTNTKDKKEKAPKKQGGKGKKQKHTKRRYKHRIYTRKIRR